MPIYFGPKEELAVEAYNNATAATEKEKIYNEILHPALTKLAECVLHQRVYQYFIGRYGDDIAQKMLLSFMVETLPKFVKSRGKAFSYLTYCGRNYCIQENEAAYTEHLKLLPIQVESNEHDSELPLPEPLTVKDETQEVNINEFLKLCADYWENKRKAVCKKPRHHVVLTELIKIMRNPDIIEYGESTGVGKRQILKHFKDSINLSTSQIRPFIRSITSKQNELLTEYIATGSLQHLLSKQ